MELEGRRRETPTINLSALIDIVFILVIFVVLAANFRRLKGVKVDLPQAEIQGTVDSKALTVTVPVKGAIQVGETFHEAKTLRSVLREKRRDHERLILRSDGQAAFERSVQVLAEARAAGFDAVSIATVPPAAAP